MLEIGNFIGHWGCVFYIAVMFIAAGFVMKKYLKQDS